MGWLERVETFLAYAHLVFQSPLSLYLSCLGPFKEGNEGALRTAHRASYRRSCIVQIVACPCQPGGMGRCLLYFRPQLTINFGLDLVIAIKVGMHFRS